MWVFTNHSFISIVASENNPNHFMIQSRFPNHIESLFPDVHVDQMNFGIYRFRAVIPKHVVSQKLLDISAEIDYQNFKDSIADEDYQTACRDVSATLDKYTPNPHPIDSVSE